MARCVYPIASERGQQPTRYGLEFRERILRKMDAIGFLEPTFHFRNVDKSINVGSVGEIRVSDGHSNRSAWTSYRPDANDNETEIRISWPAYLAHVGGHEGGMRSPALLQKYARTVIEAR